MIKQVKLDLNDNVGSLIDSEPFFLQVDEEMKIEFITDSRYIKHVSLRNGERSAKIIVVNNTFVVPQALQVEGELEVIVKEYIGSLLAHKWYCEPIAIVKASDETFEAYSTIAALKDELFEVREEVASLKNVMEVVQQQMQELWQIQES